MWALMYPGVWDTRGVEDVEEALWRYSVEGVNRDACGLGVGVDGMRELLLLVGKLPGAEICLLK